VCVYLEGHQLNEIEMRSNSGGPQSEWPQSESLVAESRYAKLENRNMGE
jgi:hypothetical protein